MTRKRRWNKEENVVVIHCEIHTLDTVQFCPLSQKIIAELGITKKQKKDEQVRWRASMRGDKIARTA